VASIHYKLSTVGLSYKFRNSLLIVNLYITNFPNYRSSLLIVNLFLDEVVQLIILAVISKVMLSDLGTFLKFFS